MQDRTAFDCFGVNEHLSTSKFIAMHNLHYTVVLLHDCKQVWPIHGKVIFLHLCIFLRGLSRFNMLLENSLLFARFPKICLFAKRLHAVSKEKYTQYFLLYLPTHLNEIWEHSSVVLVPSR